jgi:hypothetical protein
MTERLRRAFRVNDNLPGDTASAPPSVWQRGGLLLVRHRSHFAHWAA